MPFVLAALGCSTGGAPIQLPDKTSAAASSTARPATPEPVEPVPPPIRVATYNIHCGNARVEGVVDAIRQADADVVCLQETNAYSAAVLRREFADRYRYIRFFGSVRPYPAGGFGVLLSRPLARERFVPPKHGLFGFCILEIEYGEQTVQIVIVHLQPVLLPSERSVGALMAVVSAFDAAEQIHRDEITEVLAHVRTDTPTLIVGDFNSISTAQAPTVLAQHGFIDSFASVHDDPEQHPTWRWPTKFGEARLRIDYIFHTASLRTVESRVIKIDGSDHSLVVSQVEVVESTGRVAISTRAAFASNGVGRSEFNFCGRRTLTRGIPSSPQELNSERPTPTALADSPWSD